VSRDLIAAELERLRTFTREIAVTLLSEGTKTRREGAATRFLGQGGLLVFDDGSWYRHSSREGGTGADASLRLIHSLGNMSAADATAWAAAWLQSNPGVGSCTGTVDEAASAPASAIDAEDLLRRVEDPHGTVVETYLRSRRIEPPFPECIKIVRNARVGEDALAAILTARGRVVGIELTYIDPTGQKSTVAPQRRTFKREALPDAIFDIPSPGDSTDIVIAEGVPDMGTAYRWGKCRCRINGIPGIGTLRHLRFPKGTKITVVAQGDAPDSPAAKDLQAGLDKLILDGCDVYVTPTPPVGQDANSILRAHGVDAVQLLLTSAAPAKLSLDGEIEKLARLDDLAYAQVRREAARRFGIPVTILDAERRKHRAAHKASPSGTDWDDVSNDPVDHEEVDLADTLDGIVKELKRYVVVPNEAFTTMALWGAHAHLVHHPLIHLTVSPRLGIQAVDYDSGKSVTLEAIGALVPNPAFTGSISPAYLEHALSDKKLTPLLNEAHLVLHKDSEPRLRRVFNASHRRREAIARTLVQGPNGNWIPAELDVWCTMAWASVGELPREHQSRAVIVNLPKALGADVPEHLRDGTSPELEQLYTKLVVWAAGLQELEDDPPMPEVLLRQHGRVGDNWRPLLAIADLAGRDWPEKARSAALAAISAERALTKTQSLLLSIRRAFGTADVLRTAKEKETPLRIETGVLLHSLINDSEEEWDRANRGKPVTAYWLRDNLKGLLSPAGAQQWQEADGHRRGYYQYQFEEAWRTHLAGVEGQVSSSPPPPSQPSGRSEASGNGFDNQGITSHAPGAASDISGTSEPSPVPDVPDTRPTRTTKTGYKINEIPDASDIPNDSEEGGIEKKIVGASPNGDARSPSHPRRRRLVLADDIRAYAANNPKATHEQIAKNSAYLGCA
jgi:hypothetical protein